jgi:maltooligosyltrehalose trehalohydrolase
MRFEVWAPLATRVDLVLDGERIPMDAGERGWFHSSQAASPGLRYGFSLGGGETLPDPRSPFQPDGVHGLSEVIDHAAYLWSDDGWDPPPLDGWVIYEAHVGTFTPEGTFEVATHKLDHLAELGVTTLELMPVAEFPGTHGWGYDGVDLYAPHHAYGGPDGLKRLVDACHRRGLAVVMDVVYNHLGPAGNYLGSFGPYFTDKYATPWGQAVNLDDSDSGPVRDFFIDNALLWLRDYHFDGLRLDAVHALLDRSAVHLLEELATRVNDLECTEGRPYYLIAESDLNDPRIVHPPARGGYDMDAQWSDDLHHSVHALLTGERTGYYSDFGSVAQVAKGLTQAYIYDGVYSEHRRRVHGRPPEGLDGRSFLAYLQTHDQVGNRARGDRIGALVDDDLVKIGAALVLTSPFVPMLFQGEEWAASTPFLYFTDHEDPELADAVSRGRKREFESFGWDPDDVPDPQSPATFDGSKLQWDELAEPAHKEMLEWYRALLRLRAATPSLRGHDLGEVRTESSEDPPWLIVERGEVTIACNLGTDPCSLPISGERREHLLLQSGPPVAESPETVSLPPRSVAIWSC